jgi:hypothetical protein
MTKRAYVIASVEGVEGWKSKRKGFEQESFHMDASLEIGDCTKTVYLDFDISSSAQKADVLHKAKLLREVMNNFLDQVEAEAAKSDFKIKKTKVWEP